MSAVTIEHLFCHPILKTVAMCLQIGLRDKCRSLALVYINEYARGLTLDKARHHWHLYLLADNVFLVPPPNCFWDKYNAVLEVLAAEAKNSNLVGEFVFSTAPDSQLPQIAEQRWDIRFNTDPARNLEVELKKLLELTEKKAAEAVDRAYAAARKTPS